MELVDSGSTTNDEVRMDKTQRESCARRSHVLESPLVRTHGAGEAEDFPHMNKRFERAQCRPRWKRMVLFNRVDLLLQYGWNVNETGEEQEFCDRGDLPLHHD